jgi:beta-aspartyl-dipeptidase (metallo-type)
MGSSMRPLTLLRNAEVYAPEPLGRQDLLLGGASILALAPAIEPLSESLCEVFDLDGMRLLPGFVDSHVHLTGGGGESGPASRVPRVSFTDLSLAGVTTAVGVLGTDGTTRTVRELVATALALRDEGLSAYAWTGSYEVPPITLTGSVRGDIAFVDPVIGVGEVAISDHRSSQPTFDEIVRLAADCHVAGMMSNKAGVLHLHLGDGPRGLSLVRRAIEETELPPSTFFPTHVNRKHRLFDEALEIATRGVPVDVTAFPVEEGEDALAAEDAIAAYLASGAPKDRLTCSSDGGGCLPTFDASGRLVTMDVGRSSALGETLRRLLGRGHRLADVLPVFTSNVADVLRLPKKGRIAVGLDADLVTLDGEGRLRDVMARGRFVVRAGAPCVWGTFERPSPRAANP